MVVWQIIMGLCSITTIIYSIVLLLPSTRARVYTARQAEEQADRTTNIYIEIQTDTQTYG